MYHLPLRLCRNSVHGSRTSPRTEYDMLKINQLAVRPEVLEGRMANYDTASLAKAGRDFIRFISNHEIGIVIDHLFIGYLSFNFVTDSAWLTTKN